MTWYATSEKNRLGSEPVKLPAPGQRVLACVIRARPLPTKALLEAFEACGIPAGDAAAFIRSGRTPGDVKEELEKAGLIQQYAYSALFECFLVDVKDRERPRSQQASAEGWACDAMPLTPMFDTVPTHWTDELPERFEP
jgi:hypothetical protein